MSALRNFGLLKSYIIYYRPWLIKRMRVFYSQFIKPGDLAFDIGSHIGNRVYVWNQLEAKVVAFEPELKLYALLQKKWLNKKNIHIMNLAVSDQNSTDILQVSEQSPTLHTLSKTWIKTVQQDKRFKKVHWNKQQTIKTRTLTSLMSEFGVPQFCKIDTEGLEYVILSKLETAIPALSFECISINKEDTVKIIKKLNQLANYQYNFSYTESMEFVFSNWLSPSEMLKYIRSLALGAKSGDVYAKIVS